VGRHKDCYRFNSLPTNGKNKLSGLRSDALTSFVFKSISWKHKKGVIMKYFTVEDVVEMLNRLLRHGWGRLVIDVQEHKIPHYDYVESHKPEDLEVKKANSRR